MKILYYFEPWIELAKPHMRYFNLKDQLGPQIRSLKSTYPEIEIMILIGEGTAHKCAFEQYDFDKCDYVLEIKQCDLKKFYPNYLDASKALYLKHQSHDYANFLASETCGFIPDIIISFLAPLPDLSTVWPDALTLYAEYGIFSRQPYPKSYYFDTNGMFSQSSIRKYASEIMGAKFSNEDISQLNSLRHETIFPAFHNTGINNLPLKQKSEQYQCNLLLPLQFSNYFGFDCCAPYIDQFDYLIDVLDTIPSDVGIFVTEHHGWPEVITHHNIHYLEDKYPNLLWSPEFSNIPAVSQYLMPIIDGVITVSSSMGLQAMLWDKPLFSPWQSHLTGFSFTDKLSDVTIEKICNYESGHYDATILSLLSRYYLMENTAYDAEKFTSFLIHIYNNKLSHSFFELYPELNTISNVLDSIKNSFKSTS